MMIPTLGCIVHYRLSEFDLQALDHLTTNSYKVGDIIPMLVTRIWDKGESASGTGFYDGETTLWLTSRMQGDNVGQWHKPTGLV